MQTILLNYTQTQLYKEQREGMITTFFEEYDNTNNALTMSRPEFGNPSCEGISQANPI